LDPLLPGFGIQNYQPSDAQQVKLPVNQLLQIHILLKLLKKLDPLPPGFGIQDYQPSDAQPVKLPAGQFV
jgi:hypothetical protein